MGSDEGHFNISLITRDKVTRQCPQTTIYEEKGEPKRIRTEVPLLTSLTPLPLGETGSRGVEGRLQTTQLTCRIRFASGPDRLGSIGQKRAG